MNLLEIKDIESSVHLRALLDEYTSEDKIQENEQEVAFKYLDSINSLVKWNIMPNSNLILNSRESIPFTFAHPGVLVLSKSMLNKEEDGKVKEFELLIPRLKDAIKSIKKNQDIAFASGNLRSFLTKAGHNPGTISFMVEVLGTDNLCFNSKKIIMSKMVKFLDFNDIERDIENIRNIIYRTLGKVSIYITFLPCDKTFYELKEEEEFLPAGIVIPYHKLKEYSHEGYREYLKEKNLNSKLHAKKIILASIRTAPLFCIIASMFNFIFVYFFIFFSIILFIVEVCR